MASARRFHSVTVAAPVSIAPIVILLASSGPYFFLILPWLVAMVAIYPLAAVVARICYVRATPRGAAAGGATAIVVLALLWSAGHRLGVYDPMALVLGVVSLAVMLYSEDPSPTRRETRRTFGPSAVAVVVSAGCLLVWWQLRCGWRGFGSVQILGAELMRLVVLPLGWSYAICHVGARSWPAGHGWRAGLLRALPGLILTLWPVCLFALTRPRLEVGERAPFYQPPMLLREWPYLVAAAGLLLAKALRRPAVRTPDAVRNAVPQ
ncbi:MAG TPA: hypothetical protein VF384_14220 [Planctomycetota bacterium]